MRQKTFVALTIATALGIAGCGNLGSADRANNRPEVEIPANTRLYIQLDHNIDSEKASVGDTTTGRLKMAVVADGKDVIPTGTKFNIRVTNVNRAKNPGDQGLVTIALDSFDLNGSKHAVQADEVTAQGQKLPEGTAPNQQVPGLPLRENQAVSNAVLTQGHTLDFRTTQPFRFRP